jgi:hypothetical protein
LKFPAVIFDPQQVADFNLTRWFGGLVVGFDAAEFAGVTGEGSGFEEACGPEPFIDADAGYDLFSYLGWLP